jgi:hypothetical protein
MCDKKFRVLQAGPEAQCNNYDRFTGKLMKKKKKKKKERKRRGSSALNTSLPPAD